MTFTVDELKQLPVTDAKWWQMCDSIAGFVASGTFTSQYTYLISIQTVGETKYYSANNAFQTLIGGINSVGVDGTNFSLVYNACVTALTGVGGLIVLGVGTFAATAQLNNVSKVATIGAGMEITVITFDDSFSCFKASGTSGAPLTGIQMFSFSIQGTNDGVSGLGMEWSYVYSNTTIGNVSIKDVGGVGIKMDNCYAINVPWMEVTNCNDFGFLAYYCHGIKVNLKAYDCGQSSPYNPNIAFYGTAECSLTGASEGWHGNLLLIATQSGTTPEMNKVTDMYFEGSTRVSVTGGHKTVFDGCRFVGNGTLPGGAGDPTYGLVLSGSTYATTIRDCMFRGGFTTANVWVSAGTVTQTHLFDCENYEGLFLDDDGTDTQWDNIYDITDGTPVNEEAGTATLLEGNTYVEISHTIYDPDADWFTIVPLAPPRGTVHWWMTQEDVTTIRIYVDTATSGGNITFAWRLRRPRF